MPLQPAAFYKYRVNFNHNVMKCISCKTFLTFSTFCVCFVQGYLCLFSLEQPCLYLLFSHIILQNWMERKEKKKHNKHIRLSWKHSSTMFTCSLNCLSDWFTFQPDQYNLTVPNSIEASKWLWLTSINGHTPIQECNFSIRARPIIQLQQPVCKHRCCHSLSVTSL